MTREVATKYKQECQALQEHIDVMRREAIAAAEQQASLHEDHLLKLTHEHNVTVRELQEQHKQVIGTFEQAAQSKDGNDMRLQKALTAERKRMAEYQSSVREAFQEATEKNSAIILSMNEQHSSVVESLKSKHAQESADIQTKLSASYANEMQQAVIAHQLEVRELKAELRREGRTHMLKKRSRGTSLALATRDSQHAELRALNETLRRDHEQVLATKDAQHAEDLRGPPTRFARSTKKSCGGHEPHELERTQLEEDRRDGGRVRRGTGPVRKERSGIQDMHMRTYRRTGSTPTPQAQERSGRGQETPRRSAREPEGGTRNGACEAIQGSRRRVDIFSGRARTPDGGARDHDRAAICDHRSATKDGARQKRRR